MTLSLTALTLTTFSTTTLSVKIKNIMPRINDTQYDERLSVVMLRIFIPGDVVHYAEYC